MNKQKEKLKGLLIQAYKDLAVNTKDLDTDLIVIDDLPKEFIYFIGLVEASAKLEEREACAALCDDWFAATAGAAIRARGNHESQ